MQVHAWREDAGGVMTKRRLPGSQIRPRMTPRMEAFCRHLIADPTMTLVAAYRKAGYNTENDRTAANRAAECRKNPLVEKRIRELLAERMQRVEIKADDVLRDIHAIATADVRKLVEFRRTCCRYCWGRGFRYHRTAGEMERDREDHERRVDEWETSGRKGRSPGQFDEKGGTGYNAKADPNADCPECFGDGIGRTFVHDTRKLDAAAARLFAGIKESREGLEVKTLSQEKMVEMLARHTGLLEDKLRVRGSVRAIVKDFTGRKAHQPAGSDQEEEGGDA